VGEEYQIRGSIYFESETLMYDILDNVNQRVHRYDGLQPGIFHFNDSRRGISFLDDILYFLSTHTTVIRGQVIVSGGYFNKNLFNVYKAENGTINLYEYYQIKPVRYKISEDKFSEILKKQPLYLAMPTARLTNTDLYAYARNKMNNIAEPDEILFDWIHSSSERRTQLNLCFENHQIVLQQGKPILSGTYDIKNKSYFKELEQYRWSEFYHSNIDLNEKRSVLIDGKVFPLCEAFMTKRNHNLEVQPSDAVVSLPDGSYTDVCSQCIHRLTKLLKNKCEKCTATKTAI
jgi:hypothetical protein